MRPTFGLALPPALTFGRDCGPSAAEWIAHLEVPGVDRLWSLDQLMGTAPTAEPLALLGYVAALTSAVRLGVAVLVGAARGPVPTAKAIATLDWLTDGRLDVGLGLGAPWHYPAYGLDPSKRASGAVLDELVHIVPRLLTEERVDHDGPTWRLEGARCRPGPRQQPHPPLWFGGGATRSLARAVEHGVGWIGAGRHSTDEFIALAAPLRELLAARPDPAAPFAVSKRVYIVVDDDSTRADKIVREWFATFYGRPELGPDVTVAGSAEACVRELGRMVEAGATHVILHPLVGTLEQYDLVTTEVIGQLR
jgi:alkanesulfonate monooxygenase SsuD/methylene tetrahydromethanopterin reductase-like flavin-dependent oxidoreductase (luciferase family)